MKRATRSVPPPAEVATRMRTGRDGYVSAPAMRDASGQRGKTEQEFTALHACCIGGTSPNGLEHFPEKWTSGLAEDNATTAR